MGCYIQKRSPQWFYPLPIDQIRFTLKVIIEMNDQTNPDQQKYNWGGVVNSNQDLYLPDRVLVTINNVL